MTLAAPLWLLWLLPLAWLIRHKQQQNSFRLPRAASGAVGGSWRSSVKARILWLRWITLALLIIAMARPQLKWNEEKIKADALDIVLSMDISPSMLSRDFEPDRLTVSKQVAADFVENRPHDRIGLVAFSAEAFTQCPLTTDKKVVKSFIQELTVGRLEDGTAIGMGLATAVNRLKDSPSKSKVVVLITDGENNAGYIAPVQAAEMAQTLGIRVYTVGIGTEGVVMSPAQRNQDGSYSFAPRYMRFDTELLEEMAAATGGKFYRARSERDLKYIYGEIDRLEKTKIEVTTIRRTTDYFHWLVGAAVVFLLLELLSAWIFFRSVN
ncbi:MAG: VWA domain-containing protein [Saprospiraceae bacterium]|nr:VWA domain-containing protein [Saprospiraceae bacterium]